MHLLATLGVFVLFVIAMIIIRGALVIIDLMGDEAKSKILVSLILVGLAVVAWRIT